MALAKISGENRRIKSILFLIGCALAGVLPHLIEPTKNLLPSITLAFFWWRFWTWSRNVAVWGYRVSKKWMDD